MRISLAQIKSEKGNIEKNIENHKKWIKAAIGLNADLIVFPELSLTGYEPQLAKELATDQFDTGLNQFQQVSDLNKISVCLGLPIKSELGILIGMVIFQPNKNRRTYSKQILHPDEKPYFVEGKEQIILKIRDSKIAPAICYESLCHGHSENAKKMGADLYLASVAKSRNGIEKAFIHFPKISAKYSMPILMCNSIGICDNFESGGQSSIWNENGTIIGQLDNNNEGILTYDTELKTTILAESTVYNNEYKT